MISYQTNKYGQVTISQNWTRTDVNGQTYLGDLITGMNGSTANSSRRPSNFTYYALLPSSFTHWHNTIVSGIYDWRMPLATLVIPYGSGRQYRLTSWPVVSDTGHYIAIGGYNGLAGTPGRTVRYSDTAGTYASSTAANYSQDSYPVYQTMVYHSTRGGNTPNLVY